MDVNADDIAAMRREGSLADLMGLISKPKEPEKTVPAIPQAAPPREQHPDGRLPGAWPQGTRPPSQAVTWAPSQVAEALQDYRTWLATQNPEDLYLD